MTNEEILKKLTKLFPENMLKACHPTIIKKVIALKDAEIQRNYIHKSLITKPNDWIKKSKVLNILENADYGSYIIAEGEAVFDVKKFIKEQIKPKIASMEKEK